MNTKEIQAAVDGLWFKKESSQELINEDTVTHYMLMEDNRVQSEFIAELLDKVRELEAALEVEREKSNVRQVTKLKFEPDLLTQKEKTIHEKWEELEETAYCPHGFMVGCPTCIEARTQKEGDDA